MLKIIQQIPRFGLENVSQMIFSFGNSFTDSTALFVARFEAFKHFMLHPVG